MVDDAKMTAYSSNQLVSFENRKNEGDRHYGLS
jgi:hypothetical protein